MKRIILDQALSLLCAGILMFDIPFACNGVILPIVIMEAIVQFNTVLLYPIALFEAPGPHPGASNSGGIFLTQGADISM